MTLFEQVRTAGVVGAGGAGFPTHVKLQGQAEYVLLNGAECEPLLRVDQQLMARYPTEILTALNAVRESVGAYRAIIGIKQKHTQVIATLTQSLSDLHLDHAIEIAPLADIYPAGDEQVLVYELTGRVVPEMGLPLHVGCVVMNPETLLNVYHATHATPVTQTYVTLAGDIPNPQTIQAPVGTPIQDLLMLSGVKDLSGYAVIDGGPMMGPVMADFDGHLTKAQKGFIILRKDNHLIKRKSATPQQCYRINRSTCEQCRLCTDLCPRFLLGHDINPHKTMRLINYGIDNNLLKAQTQLCCGCNLCELFSCPIELYPRGANSHFKAQLAQTGTRYQPQASEPVPRTNRTQQLLPSKRLVARLGLTAFDQPAPLTTLGIVPKQVRIMTRQHVGAPAVPTVAVGSNVSVGQCIGEIPTDSLGAAIHASIAGIVTAVTPDYIDIHATKGD